MTLPEVLLWRLLRTRPEGLKFRRQHPAGPYVLDFYCESAKLAVEVDGAVHGMGDLPARDIVRDRWLVEAGIRTFRIPAKDVLENEDGVVAAIVEQCGPCQTPPPSFGWSPSPSGRI
jgi:very-short-patch-repair endonuclease